MTHHNLDLNPESRGKEALFVNEPWLADKTRLEYMIGQDPDDKPDNVRVFIPLDINKEAILRRLDRIIAQYGEANFDNEMEFMADVNMIVSQIEIYDQIWYGRNMPKDGKHRAEAIDVVKKFIKRLEDIPDGCADMFPFETIEELKQEYLVQGV